MREREREREDVKTKIMKKMKLDKGTLKRKRMMMEDLKVGFEMVK